MTKLLKYLKEYTKECVFGPLFKLFEATLELIVPLVVAAIIDKGIKAQDNGLILRNCLILVGLGLVGLIFSVTAQYFASAAASGFAKKIRHALFVHIQSLSYTKLDTLGSSTLITRMTSDTNQVQAGVNLTLRLLLRSPFVVFGAMIMAFTINTKAALVFVAAIPILSIIIFSIMFVCIPLYKKVQLKLDSVLNITRENLNGVRVIRAFGKEETEVREFKSRNQVLTDVQKYVGKISAIMNPLTYVVINLAIILLLWQGAFQVNSGTISQGQLVALYNYMSQILVELIKMASLIINLTKAVACGNRIQAIFEIAGGEETETQQQNANPLFSVEFKNVSFSYEDTAENALANISFSALPGQVIGIIGGTGAGKSTLVNLIPRFYKATEGHIFINGTEINSIPIEKLREEIGVVPQKAVLFKGTIRENLLWGDKDVSEEDIQKALEISQSTDVVNSKKDGLNSFVEQMGKNFSGGQRQRLTIARALVRHSKILILDDSASALDFATDAALRKALHKMDNKPTIFLVSQRTSSIKNADKIIVLDDGAAVGIGTHDELLKDCEVYREIYNSQFKKEAK